MVRTTDSILHYNVNDFGRAGFAVPNPGNDKVTLNETIGDLVSMIGKQILSINTRADRDLPTPPTINSIRDLHKLYLRARQIVSTRTVEVHEDSYEADHVSPEAQPFLVFPTPYRYVRNRWLKRYTQLMLGLCSDLMQHSENRREFDISPNVAGVVRRAMDRMYYDIATDLFQKTKEEAKKPEFLLTDADFSSWNWTTWYVDTERIETVVHSEWVFTEDDLHVLAQGIPATHLPKLDPFPGTANPDAGDLGEVANVAAAGSTTAVVAPPWPAST